MRWRVTRSLSVFLLAATLAQAATLIYPVEAIDDLLGQRASRNHLTFLQLETGHPRMAVAEAQAKVDAAVKVDATTATPKLMADAQAQLRIAQEDLAGDHKEQAIADAVRASQLADRALGETQRIKADSLHSTLCS